MYVQIGGINTTYNGGNKKTKTNRTKRNKQKIPYR